MATFTRALLQGGSRRARQPFPGHALELDFRNGIYRNRGFVSENLLALPGLAHSQSGSCWEMAPDGTLKAFSANQPRIVPGLGLWARGSFANRLTISSGLASLPTNGSTGNVTTNLPSPDGGNNACRLSGAANAYRQVNHNTAAATQYTHGVFVRSAAGGAMAVWIGATSITEGGCNGDFDPLIGSFTGTGSLNKVQLAGGWWFLWSTYTTNAAGVGYLRIVAKDEGGFSWFQTQLVSGPQPGPQIVSNGAQGSNGPGVMTVPFIQMDEDFVMLVAANIAEGSTGAVRYLAQLLLDYDNRWLMRFGANDTALGIARTRATNWQIGPQPETLPMGRGVMAFRYKGRKGSIANRFGAAPLAISTEVALDFPASPFTQLQIGHDSGTTHLNGIVERVSILTGTFDDAALANIVTEMAA